MQDVTYTFIISVPQKGNGAAWDYECACAGCR